MAQDAQETIPRHELTPVDDVRRIRERLSIEHDNDVEKLADHADELARELAGKLGLRPARSDKQ